MSKNQIDIDKWFKSMHEYKEEIYRRYLETLETEHD